MFLFSENLNKNFLVTALKFNSFFRRARLGEKIFLFFIADPDYHRFQLQLNVIFPNNFSKLDLLKLFSFLPLLYLARITTAALLRLHFQFAKLTVFYKFFLPASPSNSKILKKSRPVACRHNNWLYRSGLDPLSATNLCYVVILRFFTFSCCINIFCRSIQ